MSDSRTKIRQDQELIATAPDDWRCMQEKRLGDLVSLTTFSPLETQSLGEWIGTRLPGSSVLGLDGYLGAGKTCFVQGVARGLGIPSDTLVTSPAYTLVQEYPLKHCTLVHIDFYRLDTLSLNDLMLFGEFFEKPDHVIVAEWAAKFLSELTSEFLQISISTCSEPDQRQFQISSESGMYSDVLAQLSDYANTGA